MAIAAISTAAIVLVPHEIEVTYEGNGEVSTEGDSIRFYETLTVAMMPDDGWHVGKVLLDGEEAGFEGNMFEYSPSPLDFSSHSIHVVFEKDEEPVPVPVTHVISVTHSEGGTVSPSGNVVVEDGSSVTFTISPDDGYTLDRLELDGAVVQSSGTFTLSEVDSNHTLHAVFKKKSVTPGGDPSTPAVLTRIDITTPPSNTVYSIGETFDASGMTVTARYSDGIYRVLSASEYSISPAGPLTSGDTEVLVSYQGKTAKVGITVIDGSLFSTTVVSYRGTKVEDGTVVGFSEYPGCSLRDLDIHTEGIIPGVRQTLVLTVGNGTGAPLDAFVFIDDLSIGGNELADQIVITASCGGDTVSKTISEISDGNFLELGRIGSGEEVSLTVTLEFLNTEDNNEAMGQTVSFSLGVSAFEAA